MLTTASTLLTKPLWGEPEQVLTRCSHLAYRSRLRSKVMDSVSFGNLRVVNGSL